MQSLAKERVYIHHLRGLEQDVISLGNMEFSENGGARSGARSPELARIAESWPQLPPETRRIILGIIESETKKGEF